MATKKRYYAVIQGRQPGLYKEWYGKTGAEVQVKEFPNARYKGFSSLSEAKEWLQQVQDAEIQDSVSSKIDKKKLDEVIIYTDGGCLKNPGSGGYGVVLIYGKHRKELSGGFRRTTNNRMELMACLVGLRALKRKCQVKLYSDSKYVVNGIQKGWAKRWRAKGWMRNKTEPAENIDLWAELLDLCDMQKVKFIWVKGHAGLRENERCDQLAKQAALQKGLPRDEAYEKGKTTII